MEKAMVEFLKKHFGDYEAADVVKDDGKTICIRIDCGDDEVGLVTINRRKGNNGNYRIVACGL